MDSLLDQIGTGLAGAYAFYGLAFLLFPVVTFANVGVLAAVAWAVRRHAAGRRPWPWLPAIVRRPGRLALEIAFGLVNPLIYLAVLAPSLPFLQLGGWWLGPLMTTAWTLLIAFWSVRLLGAAVPQSRPARAAVVALLSLSIACVLAFGVKDLWYGLDDEGYPLSAVFTIALRIAPFYLVPVLLLVDYLWALSAAAGRDADLPVPRLFLVSSRAARATAAVAAALALATMLAAAHRRSDASVRDLVTQHRAAIVAAAARHDVDPRLVAAIVYVTHRDQLSPFRGGIERIVMSAWSRGEWLALGANETLLNQPLDLSVGLAQIKPRTAQTASRLASGVPLHDLGQRAASWYAAAEPGRRRLAGLGRDAGHGARGPAVPHSGRAYRHHARAARAGVESRDLRPHSLGLSAAVGDRESAVEPAPPSRRARDAVPDRLRPLEAARGAAKQRVRPARGRSGGPALAARPDFCSPRRRARARRGAGLKPRAYRCL
jgi:hypothetical protein